MRTASASPLVTTVTTEELTQTDLSDWIALFSEPSTVSNPFLHPVWVQSWYRVFTRPDQRLILMVRRPDNGRLIGVVPLHRQVLRVSGVPMARRLVPVGAGTAPTAFEIPGFLAAPGMARDVARASVTTLFEQRDVDWSELTIALEQGWFEPEWAFAGGDRPVAFGEHQRARACVVLPLLPTWEATRGGLKRNLKESIRRSYNRMARWPATATVIHRTAAELNQSAISRFLELHRRRSLTRHASIAHPDAYADEQNRALLRTALPTLARAGLASIYELSMDGQVTASQLALHAGTTSYVHSSGFDPSVWDLGPVTMLQTELVKSAIGRGDSVINFSPGPSVSKLRWSESLWVANDFAFASGSRRLAVRYGAFQAMSSLRRSASSIAFVRRQSVSRDSARATVGTPVRGARPTGEGTSPEVGRSA
jgi:CelD/BcsL family acetyltransferase involved in cellulose biosynthesis